VSSERPHVVVHVAVSLDGATNGFEPDIERFYELAVRWREDVTLAGADTILAQEPTLAAAARPGPVPEGPLLAVVDGRRRVSQWQALRDCGHWRDVVALRAGAATDEAGGRAGPRELVAGSEKVDLAEALGLLRTAEGAETVRVDSGGALTGALLRGGLVDELSLLVHPWLAGGRGDRRWYGAPPGPRLALSPIASEPLEGGLVWLRCRIESAA
jgi:2,5-diamino-6-(ribosylamino)-4(3H)-pyrimidinone 5'-phosphate reductase